MSYCRWSSDNYNCDLYCYEDIYGGYTTHVAGYRQRAWRECFNWLTDKRIKIGDDLVYRQSRFAFWKLPHWMQYKKIKLPYDGEHFNDSTLETFLDRLLHLKDAGYRFPDYVIDSVRQELEEAK